MVIVGRIFFVFCLRFPTVVSELDLCVDISVWLEHMLNVGIDSTFVTLSRVLVYIAVLFDEAARTDLTRTLTRYWFHT